MSEYQYYEFVAVDRPLTHEQIAELRQLSTRADISSTRFRNHYNFGDFKGSPERLMERCFDAHLYLSNWGTHRLMFRVPATALDLSTAEQYFEGDYCEVRAHGEHVILDLRDDDEDGTRDYYDGPDSLGQFISARAEMIAGDHRLLYLVWLLGIQWFDPEWDEIDLDEVEPPVPPGLGSLSGSLQAIVEFLRVDEDLLAVAAQGSGRTVGQLLQAAADRRAAAERAADEQKRREYQERMESLARRENTLWERVAKLIDTRVPEKYDAAVDVLADLRELAGWRDSGTAFTRQVGELRDTHRRLHGLMRRFDAAGLP